MIQTDTSLGTCELQRRADGAVLVRVRSREQNGVRGPDAVFAFRSGDPQFSFWDQRLRDQESSPVSPLSL